MGINRLGRRMQAREGSRWAKNTVERVFGLSAPVCPHCRSFNPHGTTEPAPDRCQKCQAPLLPPCPEHGEAKCQKGCPMRPCNDCGGSGEIPSMIDPFKWNRGLICKLCGRERKS